MTTNSLTVVVGASGDIGAALCESLRATDSELLLTGTARDKKSRAAHQRERWVQVNVTKPEEVSILDSEVECKKFESLRLVYCAGVVRDKPIALMSEDAWRQTIDVNLTGAFFVIRALFSRVAASKEGRIVLLGSAASRRGAIGQAAYAASKAGLEGLCGVVARELGRFGATCNVVAPGPVGGKMISGVSEKVRRHLLEHSSLGKFATPAQVAEAIMFLLSPTSGHITGQILAVDGGLA